MSFNDRFGITDFVPESHPSGISLSIDEFDEILAVLLLIPDKDQDDHDHIQIPRNKMNEFKVFLRTLGHSKFECDNYQLFITNYDLTKNLLDLEVYRIHHRNRKFLYRFSVPSFSLVEMNAWVENFEKLTVDELNIKYQRDLNKR